jgi:L-aminopeptidase/D-esterase-like protein
MRFHACVAAAGIWLAIVQAPSRPDNAGGSVNRTLTAVPGIKVGHHELTARPTGCTAIVVDPAAVAGVDVRGSAPGTLDTDLLDPANDIETVNAISLAGGSAFGLDAASGVRRYLDEVDVRPKVESGAGSVRVVASAILIDLQVGGRPKVRPDADCGYRAARAAATGPVPQGNVGAGAGATIGKSAGFDRAMKGGLGSAAFILPDGLIVAALVAVNAFGDVIDPATGHVIAGVRTADGRSLADARVLLRAPIPPLAAALNTTLGVVATNARLTRTEATLVARMAQDGFARAIAPIHTPYDGDTIFALSTGGFAGPADTARVGAFAADAVSEAIVSAIRHARSIPGYPAIGDWRR